MSDRGVRSPEPVEGFRMKQLKARRSVGVATALSLSLLGSLSCAAVASADEGPEPATTTSVSASPEAESTTPLLPLGESPSAPPSCSPTANRPPPSSPPAAAHRPICRPATTTSLVPGMAPMTQRTVRLPTVTSTSPSRWVAVTSRRAGTSRWIGPTSPCR